VPRASLGSVPQRVLIVDDDAAFRDVARALLSTSGYVIAAAIGTAAEARHAIEALQPDGLLLDVNLPDGDGVALAAELRAAHPDVRMLLTSSDWEAAPRGGTPPFVAKTELARTDLTPFLGKP
jgi:CheY-like chemotaxis protein